MPLRLPTLFLLLPLSIPFLYLLTSPALAMDHFHEYEILEELPANTFVGNLVIDDGLDQRYDPPVVNSLRFSLLTQPNPDRRFFAVDERSGVIHSTQRIDREKVCPGATDCVAQFDVVVKPIQYFQIIKVKIEIVDVNDNAPEFPEKRIHHQISESAELETAFVIPAARDPDSGKNGIQKYDLFATSNKFVLAVHGRADGGTDLKIVLKEPLDRETEDKYQVVVIANDGGEPPKSGSTQVDITILDANDNNPEFENATYEVFVLESHPAGTVVAKVKARDKDTGVNGQIVYEFSRHTAQDLGHIFGIKQDSGKVYLKSKLDYESESVHLLLVIANDRGPDSRPAHASVIVRVQDVNDNAPLVTVKTLTADGHGEVMENADVGSFVAYVSVTDPDSGDNGRTRCSIDSDYFAPAQTNSTDFRLTTLSRLDREITSSYNVLIACMDHGNPPLTATVHLPVRVSDDNDNPPKFTKSHYDVLVDENGSIGESLIQVRADDADLGRNGDVSYWVDANVTEVLRVNSETGLIVSSVSFDREITDHVGFYVYASDNGEVPHTASAYVQINVADVNDESPTFERDRYVFSVTENEPAGHTVGRVSAIDRDVSSAEAILYTFERGQALPFEIEPSSGVITLTEPLDHENKSMHHLSVLATGDGQRAKAYVTVHVTDLNDNRPVFTFPKYGNETVRVSSQTPIGYAIARLKAFDADAGPNANLSFDISEGNTRLQVALNKLTGVLTVSRDLTAVEFEDMLLKLVVSDDGQPELLSSMSELRIVISKDIAFVPAPELIEGSVLARDGILAIVLAIILSITILAITAVATAIICMFRRRGDPKRPRMQTTPPNGHKPESVSNGIIRPDLGIDSTARTNNLSSSANRNLTEVHHQNGKGTSSCGKTQPISVQPCPSLWQGNACSTIIAGSFTSPAHTMISQSTPDSTYFSLAESTPAHRTTVHPKPTNNNYSASTDYDDDGRSFSYAADSLDRNSMTSSAYVMTSPSHNKITAATSSSLTQKLSSVGGCGYYSPAHKLSMSKSLVSSSSSFSPNHHKTAVVATLQARESAAVHGGSYVLASSSSSSSSAHNHHPSPSSAAVLAALAASSSSPGNMSSHSSPIRKTDASTSIWEREPQREGEFNSPSSSWCSGGGGGGRTTNCRMMDDLAFATQRRCVRSQSVVPRSSSVSWDEGRQSRGEPCTRLISPPPPPAHLLDGRHGLTDNSFKENTRSTWTSLEGFNELRADEEEPRKPVIVFVKDQDHPERNFTRSYSPKPDGGQNTRRPTDAEIPQFISSANSPSRSGNFRQLSFASPAGGVNSQTLPLNPARRGEFTYHKNRSPMPTGLGLHHAVWPKKSDKVYNCDHTTLAKQLEASVDGSDRVTSSAAAAAAGHVSFKQQLLSQAHRTQQPAQLADGGVGMEQYQGDVFSAAKMMYQFGKM